MREIDHDQDLETQSEVRGVQFSPVDNRRLVIVGGDSQNRMLKFTGGQLVNVIKLWDLETGAMIRSFEGGDPQP